MIFLFLGLILVFILAVYLERKPESLQNSKPISKGDLFFEQAHQRKEIVHLNEAIRKRDHERELAEAKATLREEQKRFLPVAFHNVVLPSRGNTPHTEIDEIIVSPYGIFCIEEKAHVGFIFGSTKNKWWTQCKYSSREPLYNPLRQNYKHVRALSELLGARIKTPIHSYVLFTRASKVEVDSQFVFSSRWDMEAAIDNHTRQIYSLEEYEDILRVLAVASSNSRELMPVHIAEVEEFLKDEVVPQYS